MPAGDSRKLFGYSRYIAATALPAQGCRLILVTENVRLAAILRHAHEDLPRNRQAAGMCPHRCRLSVSAQAVSRGLQRVLRDDPDRDAPRARPAVGVVQNRVPR